MKFVLLIYQPPGFDPKSLSQEEHAAVSADYQALNKMPNVSPGPPLGAVNNAVTVRVKHGQPVAETKPFADTAAVGGYMVLEADTMEQAVELAARIPAARLGGAVEVRHCEVYW